MTSTLPETPAAGQQPQPVPVLSRTDQETVRVWKERIQRAREARRPIEKTWLSNMAFAAGQQWLVWDEIASRMRHIQDLDPRYRSRVLYTADRIRELLQSQLGELNSDDDRPDLLTAQEGDRAEAVARELNDAVAHSWRYEAKAAEALDRVRRSVLVLGHAAVRARYDKSQGSLTDHQPVGQDGKPVSDGSALDMLEQHGTLPDGSLPKFQPVHEGRTVLEMYTAFQLLTPPGVVHEDDFPWVVLVRPVLVEDLQDEYGEKAKGLVEDTDIASAAGLTTGQNVGSPSRGGGRLRDHCWLYTCFRQPCRSYPDGQTVVLASNQYRLLDQKNELPYETADGTPSAGVVYYHWWRLEDRFQSRAFIEGLKDPQRLINEMETLNAETIRRGQSKVFVRKGAIPEKPQGEAMEIVELEIGAEKPEFFNGVGPGDWMWKALDHQGEALSHASTLSPIRLGENPPGVDTYSQFFALNENENMKRDPILSDHRRQIAKLVEFLVHDIREWWPDEKTILVSGDEDTIAQQTFKKSQVPDFYIVQQAEGPAAPRSQAAEIKKIDAIWAAALASQIVAQDPVAWTGWYAGSLKAGKALELPEPPKDSQERFAEFENFLLQQGEQVTPAYYDPPGVHLPVHREAEDAARAADDSALVHRIEQHIQEHLQMAQQVAQQQAAQEAPQHMAAAVEAQQPQPGPGGAPGQNGAVAPGGPPAGPLSPIPGGP